MPVPYRPAAAVLAGLLLSLALGLHPIWPLAWIAPVLLLSAAFRAGPREAFALGLLAGALQTIGLIAYYLTTTGPVVSCLVVLLFALIWGAVVAVTRLIVTRSDGPIAMLAYPTIWAVMDLLLASVSPHGSMGSLAYSQMDALPVIQVAAIGGAPAVVFLISLPASMLAVALYRWPSRRWVSFGPPIVLFALGLAFGVWRLDQPHPGPDVSVGLAAIDRPENDNTAFTDQEPAIWKSYFSSVDRLTKAGARLVVLPEAIDLPTEARAPRLAATLADEAKARGAYLVAGVATPTGAKAYNRAWVFGPDGRRLADYAKHHPAPGEADLVTPGAGYSRFDLDGRRIGVAICKDMDFAALSRRYAGQEVEALVVPASDFQMDGWLHDRMAVLRGVEEGFSVIRSAEHGVLSVSDPFGRIAAEAGSRPGGAALVVKAPIGPRRATIYSAVGDLFGYLCAAGLAAAVASLWWRRRRRRGDVA